MPTKPPHKLFHGFSFIIAILISIFCIISVNYFTLKTLNGVRAFVSGESYFTKAQFEASRQLILFIETGKDEHYKSFQKHLSIPIGDSLARVNMDKNGPTSVTLKYLIQGKNNESNAKEILFVYRNFKNFGSFKKSIDIWRKADQHIFELEEFANAIYPTISIGDIQPHIRKIYIEKVNTKREQLLSLAYEFDKILSKNNNLINNYALWSINLIALLAIIGYVYYFSRQIHLLSVLREKTQVQNKILRQLNAEMDLFTYSVSHDLRSPITSLKGLIQLAQDENENENLNTYFQKMQMTLDRQDKFILNIINLTKHKRIKPEFTKIKLEDILNQCFLDINYMVDHEKVNIFKELTIKEVYSDSFRLKLIFNNLLSNAFKYLDPKKPYLNIGISSKIVDKEVQITIQDNGLGILPVHQAKIFDMFFVVNHESKGTGLGLYLVWEFINAIGGRIEFSSEIGFGTSFHIFLPHLDSDIDNTASS